MLYFFPSLTPCPPPLLSKKDNRGAEFWQLHDVILKMILTGMLIYVPPAERAGVAALVCMIAIANLNYFRPHKNTSTWLGIHFGPLLQAAIRDYNIMPPPAVPPS